MVERRSKVHTMTRCVNQVLSIVDKAESEDSPASDYGFKYMSLLLLSHRSQCDGQTGMVGVVVINVIPKQVRQKDA